MTERRKSGIRRKERRKNERRQAGSSNRPPAGTPERRKQADRRTVFDRRVRRRRDTPSPYTADEVRRIQRMFQEPGLRGKCPACGGDYALYPSHRRGKDTARKVECNNCSRAAVVVNSWAARLLVVSGAEAIREGIRSMLANVGHDALTEADADGGMKCYREGATDVVIVDVSDPTKFDGRDFVRRLQAEFPDARVLAMSARTGYGVGDPLAAARQLGASRTLRMPFSVPELLATISELRRA